MSDSNNNPYGCHVMRRNDDDGDVTMVAADNKDTDCFHKLDRQMSRDSLAQFGMDIGQSSADEDAFFSDDMQVTSQAHARARKPFHANHRYTKTKVRKRSHCTSHSSRHSSVTSRTASSRRSSLKRKKSKSKAPVSNDIPDQVDHDVTDKVDRDVTDDVIFEHDEVPLSRSISHPTVLSSSLAERRSRLVRRRSAITYTSTYRTLSVPPRLSPIRPSLGSLVMSATPSIASVVSIPEVCCYPAGLGRAHLRERTSWSNLMTCLAHKKENGYKMTQTELMIRKALE